jgi:fatty-acyl-CoA synthase
MPTSAPHGRPVRGELFDEPIGTLLTRWAQDSPGRTAVLLPDGEAIAAVTYGELLDAANSVANVLADLPVGARVAVWGRNCVEWVYLEYACAINGLVLAPLNTAWTDIEVGAAVDLVEPAAVFVGLDRHGESLATRAEAIVGAARVRALGGLRDLPAALPPQRRVDPQGPFLIQFTSGTTGRSKAAVLSQLSAINSAGLRVLRDTGPAVCLNSVPFHHVGGSVFVVLGALVVGGAFVLVDRFSAPETVRLLRIAGVTHLGGVPIMIEDVLDELAASQEDSASLSTVALGGASISPDLVRRVREQTGAVVMVTYGQSECPLVSNSESGDTPEQIATTCGRACEATEIRVVDPATGRLVPPGAVGEIQVHSPMVMSGYFSMPDQTAETIGTDGFLRTGDLGSVDADGYLTIHDRLRDVIIRGGENVYPAEVEAALAQHPDVAACAVVGIADARWGHLVGASVVARRGSASPVELELFLSERLAHFKIPRRWRFVETLPMTASGKIRRHAVQADMTAAEVAPTESSARPVKSSPDDR